MQEQALASRYEKKQEALSSSVNHFTCRDIFGEP